MCVCVWACECVCVCVLKHDLRLSLTQTSSCSSHALDDLVHHLVLRDKRSADAIVVTSPDGVLSDDAARSRRKRQADGGAGAAAGAAGAAAEAAGEAGWFDKVGGYLDTVGEWFSKGNAMGNNVLGEYSRESALPLSLLVHFNVH